MKITLSLIGLMLLTICLNACKQKSDSPSTVALNDTIPSQDTIGVDVAKQYVHNYAKYATADSVQDKAIKKKQPNTRCIWFSLKRLQMLINKVNKEGGDGVRFYLADYDTTYIKNFPNTTDSLYWGHNTLLMVSTYRINAKVHQDYYFNGPVTDPKFNIGSILMVNPENRGELCPPPNPCTGATLLSAQ